MEGSCLELFCGLRKRGAGLAELDKCLLAPSVARSVEEEGEGDGDITGEERDACLLDGLEGKRVLAGGRKESCSSPDDYDNNKENNYVEAEEKDSHSSQHT